MPPFGQKPPQTITNERYLEIDTAMKNIPEGTPRLTHILNMSRRFGNDLSIYQGIEDLKESGVITNNPIPLENKTEEDKKVINTTMPHIKPIDPDKHGKDGKSISGNQGKDD